MAMSPDIASIIVAAAQKYGRNPNDMLRKAQIESGGNPDAQNPRSSAGGLYQFIDSTAKQYGLSNKFDPAAAADAAARLDRDNEAYLTRTLGRPVTGGELYLAHQQGMGGAAKILSNPDAPAASLVGAKAVTLNGGSSGETAGQFASRWTGKFDGSGPAMTLPGDAATSGRFTATPAGIEGSNNPAPTMATPEDKTDDTISASKILQGLMQAGATTQPAAQPAPAPVQQLAHVPRRAAPFDAASFFALLKR